MIEFYVSQAQYMSYGNVSALLVEEHLRCLSYIISGTNGHHLKKTTNVP
jgi:hypothetical protein